MVSKLAACMVAMMYDTELQDLMQIVFDDCVRMMMQFRCAMFDVGEAVNRPRDGDGRRVLGMSEGVGHMAGIGLVAPLVTS